MGFILRILIIGLIFWGIYKLVRKYLPKAESELGQDHRDELKSNPDNANSDNDTMRKCAYCQVHIPEGESTRSRGHFFCSEAHRDAFFNQSK